MKEMQLKFLLIIIRSLQLGFCWCLAHDQHIWKKYKKSGNHCQKLWQSTEQHLVPKKFDLLSNTRETY